MLTLESDSARRGGGYAVLSGEGLDRIESLSVENRQNGLFLGLDGQWAKARALLPVSAPPSRPDSLSLEPYIVDFIPTDVHVAFYDLRGESLGTVFWSDIIPSRDPGKIKPQDILARRPVVVTSQPKEIVVPEQREEPEPREKRELREVPEPREELWHQKDPEPQKDIQPLKKERLPPLPPVVWRSARRAVGRDPMLLVICAFPSATAFAIFALIIIATGKLPLSSSLAGLLILVVFILFILTKVCQRAVILRTYAQVEISQGIPAVRRNAAIQIFWMILLSIPTMFCFSVPLALLGLPYAAIFFAASPVCVLEGLWPPQALARTFGLIRKGYVIASVTTAVLPYGLFLCAGGALIFLSYGAAADRYASENVSLIVGLLLIPLGFTLSGIGSTALFAELRRRLGSPTPRENAP